MSVIISNAQKIDGWMSDTELRWLAERARESMIIVEAGSYKGRSTMVLADNCPGIVISVDPYSGEYYYDDGRTLGHFGDNILFEFEKNLRHHLNSCKVLQVRCPFNQFVFTMRPDFIFIDGDHRYETVKSDIEHAKSLLMSGGILAGHDYTHHDWPGVKKAVDELVSPINSVESIWWKRI